MKRVILSTAIIAALAGCGEATAPNTAVTDVNSTDAVVEQVVYSDEAFVEMLDAMFMENVRRYPEFMTMLGMKDDYDQWNDISDAAAEEDLAISTRNLAALRQIDASVLNESNQLSLRMAIDQLERSIQNYQWRYHSYPVNQMFGRHSGVPATLINQHRITSVEDAEAYIGRLANVQPLFVDLEANLRKRQDMGIMPPQFVFPMVISDSRNIITGAPFDEGDDSTLYADFKSKVAALDISDEAKADLTQRAAVALVDHVGPAYESLIALLEAQSQVATTEDGAWKLPDGDAFYNNHLAEMTTTSLTADEIHNIGLAEVERIHSEMRAIMAQVEFDGDLQDFFEFMRTDPQFYYPNTDEGRQAYLDEATRLIDVMKTHLDDYFGIQPKADMIVKAVEPFREQSAGKAFYNMPAPDGSRPGIYYANLYDMQSMPIYQMEALAYHEGLPGHHMQLAISQELDQLPMSRRFARFPAYSEGWGLYTELLPKEMGFYQDPYSDFGRLAMELWRACRLVVDTGLHSKRWTREEAIDYLKVNTPNPEGDIVKAIERYIVMPGQATAYKIGMIKILELREHARNELGDQFDIRGFHDVFLGRGPVPLNILEENVNAWIEEVKAGN